MKKITGKVVSLVLALALVVSSFSANFAFASTKSMAGAITKTNKDDIYLCNGGTDDQRQVDLNDFLKGGDFKFKTKTNKVVDTDVYVTSMSHVSGDRLVTLKVSGDNDEKASLKLKSSDSKGKEVIAVLFKGKYTDDDGNEYTVKGSQNLTVHVYDKDEIVFGKKDSNAVGEGVDELDEIPQTAGTLVGIGIYKVTPNATDAKAVLSPAENVYLSDKTSGFHDSGYAIDVTSGDNDFHFNFGPYHDQIETSKDNAPTKLSGSLTAVIGKLDSTKKLINGDASTGNVTLTAKQLVKDGSTWKTSSDSKKKYTMKTKIAKKVDIDALKTYDKDNLNNFYSSALKAKNTDHKSDTNYEIEKDDGKTILTHFQQFDGKPAVVTDKEIHFPDLTEKVTVDKDVHMTKISGCTKVLSVGNATIGTIDVNGGSVTVDEGRVGDIKLGDAFTKNEVIVESGAKVGKIDTTDCKTDDGELVEISGSTATTIKCDGTVKVSTPDDDHPAVTDVITAKTIDVNADQSKVTIAGLVASDDDATFTLYNPDNTGMTVGKINFDNYKDCKLDLGDDGNSDNYFTGTVAAPVNAADGGKIETKNDNTNAVINGKTDVDTISVDSDTRIAFTDEVKVKSVDGDGTMTVVPGKLYVKESASSTKLKLAGDVKVGAVAFKADAGNVDVSDFNCYGFTLDKSTASGVDTFKIKSVSFAGLQINKTASSIAKGYSETFTASAYPTGTTIPTGYTVKWDLDGGSSDVFSLTSTGNTATVKVDSVDTTFATQNHATLTATLYDADGYEVEDYDVAKCDLTATAVPAATIDTTHDFSVAQGASYQFKVTSTTTPSFTVGTQGVFNVALASKNGNDYFYKITAVGKVGSSTGVYLNGTKVCVVSVKAPAFTCDTNKDITVKGAYQVKVTATATPTFSVGTAGVFKASFVKKVGNDYFYKIESVGKAGTKAGIFVNGVKVFVATVG